jgi:hypothetical protein
MRRTVLVRHYSSGLCLAALLLAAAWFVPGAQAQEKPSATGSQAVLPETPKPAAPPHRFWDRTNVLLFSGVAAFRGLDYASTRNFMARGRDEILLPDDVVNNSAGFASLEAAATATSIGLSYWMHRTGHHKIERWISITHISVAGFGDVRNYALKSKHPVK